MRREWIRLALCVAACSAPIAASGQSLGSSYGGDTAAAQYPISVVDRPLTLPHGILEITAPLGVSLSTGAGGKPTFLNPSISYGVSDELTVGIRHFLGLCFSGKDGNCPDFYNDLSLDVLYALIRAGRLQIAAGAALNFAPITDPTAVSGELRLPIKFGSSLLALVLSPTLNFGLNERDAGGRKRYGVAFNAGTYDVIIPAEVVPNREVLRIPLTFQLQMQRGPVFIAGASVDGALDPPVGGFSDVYRIPVMLGVIFSPWRFFDLGAALTFPDLLGQDATADDRFLSAFATLRI
jgi:hypothetical protein